MSHENHPPARLLVQVSKFAGIAKTRICFCGGHVYTPSGRLFARPRLLRFAVTNSGRSCPEQK